MIQKMERVAWLIVLYYLICCEVICCITIASQANHDITTDRSALLALKARVTIDPQKKISANWSISTHVCNWIGVTCVARHHRVAELNLSYFGLAGTLPPELGNLSYLVSLHIRNNSFHSFLPPELAGLRRLKSINLGYNNFKGFIPRWFGSLSKLQMFRLYGNQFSGSIPAKIFNLSDLQVIDLRYNQLSGGISREIENLKELQKIYLDGNNFEGIPYEIGGLNKLQQLYVQENNLKGNIPMNIFNISSLIILTFYRNKLMGRIPNSICERLPYIQVLNLGCNEFNGPLPSKLWKCNQLLALNLEENKFSGSIQKDLGNLTQLKVIGLTHNNLIGNIPYEIGHLVTLEKLLLGGNNLKGHIPSSIFNMSKLTHLDISTNQISGSLPTNIVLGLPNLEQFLAAYNLLSGFSPSTLSSLSLFKNLRVLDLSYNLFSGFIPSSLCLLKNLEWLSFCSNYLTVATSTQESNVFGCLANLTNLRVLSLYDNPLNTVLPISFSNFSASLEIIDFGTCGLRGEITKDIGNLSGLIELSLIGNKLSGQIPSAIGMLHNLQGLYLLDNTLNGNIPKEVCQLQSLVELSLERNLLSGSIPPCLGNLTLSLRKLFLRSNLLNSSIPSTLWGLTDILQIDLASNSLTGAISSGVGNLKVATLLDLSYNQLAGIIPSSVGSLLSMLNLSLAHNRLEGSIPSSFTTCLSLVYLDLSHNSLSGVIPKSLEALSYLKYLNLSFNQLQGEIPNRGPFENFSAEIFVSNDRLCGMSRYSVPPCEKRSSVHVYKFVITGILSLMFFVACTISLLMVHCRRRNVENTSILTPQVVLRRISYLELLSATNGFSESNLLGIGGFGSVYKGTLSGQSDVAIKVFNLDLEEAFTSFEVECEVLRNVRHRNLVKVITCCSQIDFKGLVLRYMANGSLEKWLYTRYSSLNTLNRLDIMIDVASALEYLHYGYEVPVVHCDLKPSNILLDEDMVAHVTDFGISKLLGGGDSMTQTMTLATIGYMPPEYGMEGIVTRRGDVYSFGIVLMEIFTRRKPTDDIFVGEVRINQWIANFLVSDRIVEVVDATLLGTKEDHDFVSKKECLSSVMRLAVACSAESPQERINIQEALAVLKRIKIKFLKDSVVGDVASNRGHIVGVVE